MPDLTRVTMLERMQEPTLERMRVPMRAPTQEPTPERMRVPTLEQMPVLTPEPMQAPMQVPTRVRTVASTALCAPPVARMESVNRLSSRTAVSPVSA
jgi:hypothetical protein